MLYSSICGWSCFTENTQTVSGRLDPQMKGFLTWYHLRVVDADRNVSYSQIIDSLLYSVLFISYLQMDNSLYG